MIDPTRLAWVVTFASYGNAVRHPLMVFSSAQEAAEWVEKQGIPKDYYPPGSTDGWPFYKIENPVPLWDSKSP